ncbi:S-adenosyl-l-methionine hydroxide adenosyltransferase family protein [Arcanobacterium phocisimile]|uniref:S-adenosyl-l-methionine hydroxide adenosyltransferase family protein n=1 Tax=Arcanobacterium phocisimile TaxID=1302235 RepID=A0ABX7IFJ6_9ACTO|nr:S-adenosyl-l-methionine hydroxide adenosyltransferase family protein [Arcanobacterium phocisimile]QRV01630.1 S-adenosyl-l-methionine hydroxide adenosyltransferase family protein [Arcanobacterium phocisimile]
MDNLVLQSDFGLDDGAVAAMYGVAVATNPDLHIYNLTHNIPPYDIWEGSYRLAQTIDYWPHGTVFVSVVDPGVGSDRLSVVAKTKTGHYIVTPNNGTLTHVHAIYGITEIRTVDETINRRAGSEASYTFHGRDIYAYSGARLAAGIISFNDVGPRVSLDALVTLDYEEPVFNDGEIRGIIEAHDVRYGSLWTSIPRALFLEMADGFNQRFKLRVFNQGRQVHSNHMVYVPSFASVEVGDSLLYVNSLDRMAIAINRGSYAHAFNIGTGTSWQVSLAPYEL